MAAFSFRLLVAGLLVGTMTQSAFAYLDPGTGSIVLQALLGTIAAVAIVAKSYWYRIKGWLSIGKEDTSEKSGRSK